MKIAIALLHLVFATTWLGTDFYFNFVVTPRLRTLEPSVLEEVAASLRRVTTPLLAAPFPDYKLPWLGESGWVTAVIGAAGTLVAFAFAWLLARMLVPKART